MSRRVLRKPIAYYQEALETLTVEYAISEADLFYVALREAIAELSDLREHLDNLAYAAELKRRETRYKA